MSPKTIRMINGANPAGMNGNGKLPDTTTTTINGFDVVALAKRKRFYWIGNYRYKLVSYWIDFYLDHVPLRCLFYGNKLDDHCQRIEWRKKYRFNIDEFFTMFLMLVLTVRSIYALTDRSYWTDRTRQMYFGSFFGLVNAHPFHVEVLCGVWALNHITVQLVSLGCRLKHFKWLEIILFLEKSIPASFIDLQPNEAEMMRKKATPMLILVSNGIMSVSGMTVSFLIYFFYKDYTLINFITFGIPWLLFYGYLTTLVTAVIYMTNAYVFVISLLMRSKFTRFQEMLAMVLNQRTLRNNLMGQKILYKSYEHLNNLLKEYDNYNRFWKWIFTSALFWRLVIINFIGFVVFFYDIQPSFKILYSVAFMNENMTFVSMLIQVGVIHLDMYKSGRRLRQFLMQNQRFPSLRFKFKTMNYVDFLQDPKRFGQKTITGGIIHLRDVALILREFSVYFFLLASLSFKYNTEF